MRIEENTAFLTLKLSQDEAQLCGEFLSEAAAKSRHRSLAPGPSTVNDHRVEKWIRKTLVRFRDSQDSEVCLLGR